MRRVIGSTVVLFVVYMAVGLRQPAPVGLWQDDGIYVATAEALARGDGYRHIELPDQPLQTKYPILYPAMLAAVMRACGAGPTDYAILLTPTALGAALLVVLSVRYWCTRTQPDRAVLIAGAVLAGLSPVIWSHVRFCMSDLVYGAISLAALLLLDPIEKSDTNHRGRSHRMWLGAVLAALAVLTRGVGVTLVAAAVLIPAWRRRWRRAASVCIIAAIILTPWYVRQWWAAAENGWLQHAFLYRCDLAYSVWLPSHPSQVITTFWQNAFRSMFGVGYFQLALPRSFVMAGLAAVGWRTVVVHAICYLASAAILTGFLIDARRRWRTVHLYAVLYTLLVLAWPFDPFRFWIPWTPLMIFWGLSGIKAVAGRVARLVPAFDPRRTAAGAVVIVAAGVGWLSISDDVRIVSSTAADYYLREAPVDWTERAALMGWLDSHTHPDAVIASAQPAGIFLATGRRGHYFWPDDDPYRLSYGADRSFASLYIAPGASEVRFVREQIRDRLVDVYNRGAITHYVHHAGINTMSDVLGMWLSSQPSVFARLYTTPAGRYTVYAYRPARQ